MSRRLRVGSPAPFRGNLLPNWPLLRPNRRSDQWRGLAYWWPLDGQSLDRPFDLVGGQAATADSTGNVYHANPTLGGVAFFSQDGGQTRRLNVGLQSLALPAGAISCWARTDTLVYAVDGYAVGRNAAGANDGDVGIIFRSSNSKMSFFLQTAAGTTSLDSTLTTDTGWHLFVGTWDANGCDFWTDGGDKVSGTGRTLLAHGSRGFAVGYPHDQASTSDGIGWTGNVSDFRIYSRKLDDADVAAMFDPLTRWDLWDVPSPWAFRAPSQSGGAGKGGLAVSRDLRIGLS